MNEKELQEDIKHFQDSLCQKYNKAIRLRYNLNRMSIPQLIDAINEITGHNICKQNREEPLSTLRQIYCKLAADMGYTRTEIGKNIHRDHSSVTYAISALNNKVISKDRRTIEYLLKIQNQII